MVNQTVANWIYKSFIGGGVTLTIGLLTVMGNGIIENERRNVDDHKAIRYEVAVEVNDLKDVVTDVRLEQREQRTILERIEAKL